MSRTYGWGPKYADAPEGFTFQKVKATTDALNSMSFARGEIKFAPEPTCEGGIEMIAWPGKQANHFKTIRIHVGNWPRLDESTRDVVDPAQQTVRLTNRYHGQKKFCTFLKALNGAPAWKADELKAVKDCMEQHMHVSFSTKRKRG